MQFNTPFEIGQDVYEILPTGEVVEHVISDYSLALQQVIFKDGKRANINALSNFFTDRLTAENHIKRQKTIQDIKFCSQNFDYWRMHGKYKNADLTDYENFALCCLERVNL